MRPALIFDFGNVVAHFDYTRACDRLGRPRGVAGEQLLRTARERGLDALVRRYESGGMTCEAFSEAACRLVGLDLGHAEFAASWADIFWPNEPVGRLVAWLDERGYTLVLGSNTNPMHAGHFRRQFAETLGRFDRLVLSYEVGHVKPAPEFYRACAAAAARPAGECVFIDDLEENVAAARRCGLRAIRYESARHASLLDELARLGVEVPAPDVG